MKVKILCLCAFLFLGTGANAVTIGNGAPGVENNTPVMSGATISDEDKQRMQTISVLENDIRILDSEIAKCQKSKKGWIAATVIGSAGVVATGVAAGVRGALIVKKKEQLSTHNADIEQKQQELEKLQK